MSNIWTKDEEARRLKERLAAVQNKAAFARSIGLSASMLSQHSSGHRPINLDHATAYARAFNVPLEEISPRLALVAKDASRVMETHSGDEPQVSDSAPQAPTVGDSYTPGQVVRTVAMMLMSLGMERREQVAQLATMMFKNGPSPALAAAIDDIAAPSKQIRDELAHGMPARDEILKRYVMDTMSGMSEQERSRFLSVAEEINRGTPLESADVTRAVPSEENASKRVRS